MENKGLKIVGVALAGLVIGAGAGYVLQPEPVVITKQVIKEVPVEVLKNVTIEKQVLVDNGDLALVTQRLEDKGFYQDAQEVVLEVKAEDEAKKVAVEKVKEDAFHMLENKGLFEDQRYLKFLSLKTKWDELNASSSDYDASEYSFVFPAKVRDERKDLNKKVLLYVSVNNGVADLTNATLQ